MGVLLIDDDLADLRLLSEAFREAAPDVQLHTARTAAEGMERLRSGSVRLVLLDLNMPGMRGSEVVKMIRDDPDYGSTPILILTTSAAGRDVTEAYQAGASAFITKPPELQGTMEAMRTIAKFWLELAVLPGCLMRIVSLVPSHTESLHDLGFADQVVGRTRFCIFPTPWVETIPHVGGTKDARLDRIVELDPDLVVVDKDENPLALVKDLQDAGIEVLHSEIDTVQDAAAFLVTLADRCGDRGAGEQYEALIEEILDEVGDAPRIPVWCPIWHDPWMSFDDSAYPSAMLGAVGLDNVFAAHEGPKYFEVTPAEVAASGATWSLLPTEPFPFHKQIDRIDLDALGAPGKHHRIIDGEALTWFGTRTAPGLRELARVAQELGQAD